MASSSVDEERRRRMREVELACARLEAELEESGGLSGVEIASKVADHRTRLQAEVERWALCGVEGGGDVVQVPG